MKTTKYVLGLFLAGALALTGVTLLGASLYGSNAVDDRGTIVLSSHNVLVLNSIVDGDSVGNVLEQAKKLDHGAPPYRVWAVMKHAFRGPKPAQPIYLFLNTPGGSIQSGMELIEGLNGLKRPVHTVTSFAASMGMQIAQGVNGERLILQHGVMMSHQGTGEFSGQFGGYEPSQAYNRYRIWAQRLKEMDERTVSRSGGKQTLESYQKAYNHELWVTGPEAVSQGYADRVVKLRCDDSLAGSTTHELEFMGIPVAYDMDNCPINTSPRNVRVELRTNKGTMSVTDFRSGKGSFGALCLQEAVIDNTRLCALDTTLSYEKLSEIKQKFLNSFEINRNNIVPMTW